MSNALVSVIIVTAGKDEHLKSCLDSVTRQTHPKLEIIVIDNSTDDNLIPNILRDYPEVNLYQSRDNLFYCEGLNKGISMSSADYILCLNDDVILDRQFIEEALRGFARDGRVGSVSGKILRSDKQTIDSTGLFLSFWRTAKERGYGYKDKGQFEKEQRLFGVNGAAAFYRRDMLDEIKDGSDYFDRDFRMFYEDLDVAWRAKRRGWIGYYIPAAVAYHIRGGSARLQQGRGRSYARTYLNDSLHADLVKNRYLVLIKNESWPGLLLHLPGIIFYDFIVWIYIIIFRPRQIKTFLLNSKYLKSALRKRRKAGYSNG